MSTHDADTPPPLTERQAEVLRSMKNREDEILNKQVEEAEEKALAIFKAHGFIILAGT